MWPIIVKSLFILIDLHTVYAVLVLSLAKVMSVVASRDLGILSTQKPGEVTCCYVARL